MEPKGLGSKMLNRKTLTQRFSDVFKRETTLRNTK